MEELKYTTIFSSTIKPLVSEEKDKYLAMASLLDVGDFIPEVDTEKNIDLLPIAFNACVANRVNKNGDVIDTPTALEIYENFINKPINIEHNRDRVVGAILTAGFSEFGTDKQITAEELKDHKGPFNITLGGIVWKVVNSNLAKMIEDSADPTSEKYQKISASWELGFSDYDLVVIEGEEKNIENAEFVTETEKIGELRANLRSLGGTGKLEDGRSVYRRVTEQVVPLGIGLTETPAADVQGVAVQKEQEEEKQEEVKSSEKLEKTSQSSDNNVNNNNQLVMKIESIKDINDESLKTLEASAVHDFIHEQLQKASEDFSAQKKEKEEALEASETKLKEIEEEREALKKELEDVQAGLSELKDKEEARLAQEKFNERMASFDEEFQLTDEDREVLAKDVADMDDETFSAYGEKMKVLLKDKNKKMLEEKKKKEEDAKAAEAEASEEIVASESEEETSEEIVDEAIDNAEVEDSAVAATTDAQEASVYDKYKNAFSIDNFDLNN